MDSVFKQTIMLMDKTRVDYDRDEKGKRKATKAEEEEVINFNKELGKRYKDKFNKTK